MLQLLLFILTFVTTTLAGMEWITGISFPITKQNLFLGLPFSISILFVLGCHEFGHYFAAKYHKVEATLPYFIPFPSLFGTMGAVIRTKSPVLSNRAMFDIGIYGPIAGFIASIFLLIFGFTHLPGFEYILAIHPDYNSPGFGNNSLSLRFGNTLLFMLLKYLFTNFHQFVPPMTEIYHYPYLCVGWFGLFITALNMVPIGQLDGGHITYSLFGDRIHRKIGCVALLILVLLGVLGVADLWMNGALEFGWSGWLLWAGIAYFIIKIRHPPVVDFCELDFKRKVLGYLSFFIFFISFSPTPIGLFTN